MPYHELEKESFPNACIEDCSAGGPVDEQVSYWVDRIDVLQKIPRADLIHNLLRYGAWERAELGACTDRELREKTLWLACGDFSEGCDVYTIEGI